MLGITSYGAYIPYCRLPRSVINKAWDKPGGKGEKAIASYDEDPISMSVAAGIDCLTGLNAREVDGLFMATTTAPYKERQNSTIVSSTLNLPREARNADFANCLRAGTSALFSALDAVKAGSAKNLLVVAADMRIGGASGENEQFFGDGSAALLIGDEGIAEIEGIYTLSDDFVDCWRTYDDAFVRNWEDRFGLDEGYFKMMPEAANAIMDRLNLVPGDFAKACFYGPNMRRHADLGKRMGFKPDQIQDPLLDMIGNTGVALSLMILVAALEEAKPGDRILVLNWGNGSDAMVLRVTEKIRKIKDRRGIKRHLATRRTLENYQRYLSWRGIVPLEPAARPTKEPTSMSSLWREHRSALPLNGVKCRKCNTPQLFLNPSSTRARVCVECLSKDDFEPYKFADKKGTVVSFSHDYLAVSSNPPTTLTVVDFEGGGRGAFEMVDRDPAECKVGMAVEMTFRKLFFDKGVHNYFWKCRPMID